MKKEYGVLVNLNEKTKGKQIFIVLVSLLLVCLCVFHSKNVILAEDRVPEGYTPVYTVDDLYGMRNDWHGNYILMNDIDLSETRRGGSLDTGNGWIPIHKPDGIIDGNGFAIRNMHIYVDSDLIKDNGSYIGFIGRTDDDCGLIIKNLSFEDAVIEVDMDTTGKGCSIGIIVGDEVGCNIENCYTSGEITGNISDSKIGGIVGGLNYFEVESCYTNVKIDVCGDRNSVGGVCGKVMMGSNSPHNYSLATISVRGDDNTINIVGVGGFYLSSLGSDSKAKALTETQMKSEQFFTGFDFEETWFIDPYSSYAYPQLRKVPATKLKEIKMVSAPAKNKYYTTEKLDLTGAKVMLSYEDGKEITIDIPESMVSYEMKAGTTAVKVSYLGKETTFDIFVEDGSSVCYFDENGGDTVYEAYRELEIGEKYGELPKAERGGYIFNGWYTKKQGGDAITDETVASIPGDYVVYAHWTKAKLKKVKGLKVSSGSKMIGARWSKTKNAIGYEIMYSLNSSMSSTKTVQTDKLAKTIKGLSAKTKYYLQVRAYTEDSKGNKVYGKWSKKVSVTTKQ